MQILRVAVLCIAALLPISCAAAATLKLTYNLSAAGFSVLNLEFDLEETETSYRVAGVVHSVGIADIFSGYVLRTKSQGTVASGQFHPSAYTSDSRSRLRQRFVRLRFQPDGSVLTFLAPPEDPSHSLPTEQQIKGSVDPLTGLLQASHTLARLNLCEGQIPIFDGRRRYQLTFRDEGIELIPASGEHAYAGDARHCRVDMTKIAGFRGDSVSQGAEVERAQVWMAAPLPNAPPMPIRIEFSGNLGPTTVWLVAAHEAR